jgi:hypothetical protein
MLALYQSGLSSNRLSFTSLLPFEDFENIYNDTIEKLESLPNIETFANLNVFERNNWGNDEIVPNEKARWINLQDGTPVYNPAMKYLPKNVQDAIDRGEIPQILSRSTLGRNSDRDFFVYSWEDASITKDKKAEMRKKGDFSYIKRGLFKRVKSGGEPFINTSKNKDYFIYQAVNAWGARERAQEFYDVEKPSMLDNGFIKVDNVAADERIVNLFMSKKSITARTEAPQPSSKSGIEYTPENITSLKPNEVFVFGSNDRGNHGKGAAKTALDKFGAIYNQASGRQGQSFAVRTKMYQDGNLLEYNKLRDENKKKMDSMTVQDLNNLRLEALTNPDIKYYVTQIGTKLAGRTVNQMKSFFERMNNKFGIPDNLILPKEFEVRKKLQNSQNKPGDLPSTNRSPKSC